MKIIAAMFGVFFLLMSICGGAVVLGNDPYANGFRGVGFFCLFFVALAAWAMFYAIRRLNAKKKQNE